MRARVNVLACCVADMRRAFPHVHNLALKSVRAGVREERKMDD